MKIIFNLYNLYTAPALVFGALCQFFLIVLLYPFVPIKLKSIDFRFYGIDGVYYADFAFNLRASKAIHCMIILVPFVGFCTALAVTGLNISLDCQWTISDLMFFYTITNYPVLVVSSEDIDFLTDFYLNRD